MPIPEILSEVDRRFRLFVERVEDYAIFMLDRAGRVASWNEGAQRIKGYRTEEIIGQPMSRFYTPEDLERGLPAQLLRTAEREGTAQSEGWRVRKDGSLFWASVSITAIRDEAGTLQGFGKVTHDLTERKRAEESFRELSGRLLEAQDRERKRISVSLSDSTSPSFTALLSKLYQARKGANAATAHVIDDGIALAEFLYREIRTFSYLLHPPSLDQEGLLVTLRSYLEDFSTQKKIAIDVDFPAHFPRLPEASELALYRVVQECLPNLLHVSGNSRAKVRLTVDQGEVKLQITDKGTGLSAPALEEAKRGMGELGVALAGMRERLVRLGGSLAVTAAALSTSVTVTLPSSPP